MSVDQVMNALGNLRSIMDNRAVLSLLAEACRLTKKDKPETIPKVAAVAADAAPEFPTDSEDTEFPSDKDDGWG